jgi:hypothetical protein
LQVFRPKYHVEQTSGLRNNPLVDEELRLLGEAEEELTLNLHCVDRLYGFVDLVVKRLDLLKLRGNFSPNTVEEI